MKEKLSTLPLEMFIVSLVVAWRPGIHAGVGRDFDLQSNDLAPYESINSIMIILSSSFCLQQFSFTLPNNGPHLKDN